MIGAGARRSNILAARRKSFVSIDSINGDSV
jgi:hypothetical protein